jgi:vancomycin permeability regulator SanA
LETRPKGRVFLSIVVTATAIAGAATVIEIATYSHRSDQYPADAAIVLGAAVFDDVPSPVFQERIRHAVGLYRSGQVRTLIMTGGTGTGDQLSEADAARR